ncbi:MAG: outer membrane protein transport protein [Oligoflexia bacterium]|nr:outer membrane protein transport protein [Oligoflexia bacterium]
MLNFNFNFNFNFIFLFLFLFILPLALCWADGDHYKNALIGGRAATMGGAYVAISDDASGSYYNPGGLAYASGSSISGSANTYYISKAKYKNTIGNRDWDRENINLLPNFFGIVQKFEKFSFGLSYVVPDSFIEHQDQYYRDITETSTAINIYTLNIHSEDNTYQMGPSFAYEFAPSFSLGLTLHYHYRVLRKAQSQLVKYSASSDESSYLNTLKKEKGIKSKLGLIWSPIQKLSLGFTAAKTIILTALNDSQQNSKVTGSSSNSFDVSSDIRKRQLPYEFSLGAALFTTPYFLISSDFSYYLKPDETKEHTWNAALGSEIFLGESNALRFGLYTNRTNNKDVSSSTLAPHDHIDYYGGTLGWSLYSKATTITFGGSYSYGSGKAQVYSGSTVSRDFNRYTMNFILAVDYGL